MTNLGPTPFPMPGTAQHDHPFAPLPADLAKLAVDLSPLLPGPLLPGLYTGNVPTGLSTIDPDDAAVTGTTGSGFARGDHQHAIAAATAADLTRVAASAEGASASFARADHVHDTEQMAWGTLPNGFIEFTTNSAGYTVSTTTDFVLTNVAVLNTRNYEIGLISQYALSAGGNWTSDFRSGGTTISRLHNADHSGAIRTWIATTFVWRPSSSATVTLDVRATEHSGAATFTYEANTGAPSPHQRQFWIKDIGPRV